MYNACLRIIHRSILTDRLNDGLLNIDTNAVCPNHKFRSGKVDAVILCFPYDGQGLPFGL